MNKLPYLLVIPLISASDRGPAPNPATGDAVPMRAATGAHALSIRPVNWRVVGGGSPFRVIAGRTVPITLQADIARGWHIYSLTQKPGGPIPLSINLIDPVDVVIRGVIKAPTPERIFDGNFGMETELYSGAPRFTVPVGVSGRSPTGARQVQLGARYQVCSARLCLPARTDKLFATLHVEKRK